MEIKKKGAFHLEQLLGYIYIYIYIVGDTKDSLFPKEK